jgi:acyl-CoA thioester hydrolase
MIFPAPFMSSAQRVENEWIDYNGHFNMAYYNVIFDRAADEVFGSLGLSTEYVQTTNNSFFTLEAHITYIRELHALDVVRIETQFLDADQKRVHYVQRMVHESERWLSCVLEVIVSHVDLAAKKTTPFPPEVKAAIDGALIAHKHLPVPPQVGHKIGIPRKSQA